MTVAEPPTVALFLDGKRSTASALSHVALPNPASGRTLALVPLCGADDVDTAVKSASLAFRTWSRLPVVERAAMMFRYKAQLEEHTDRLAHLLSEEHGKTLAEATAEVRRGIDVVDFACGIPNLMKGITVGAIAGSIDTETWRYPLGVVAGITPFNFPAMIPLWMFPLAVAAGNTFVLKPSERTPRTAVALAELFSHAGVPDGVLNVVHGDRGAVDALLEHPLVKAISFVGSQPVAEYIYRTAASYGKRVQALAGAKNHLFILPDAVLDKTVPSIISSAFANAGERCLAGSVVVAVGSIGDDLVRRLVAAAAALRVGVGDTNPDMGPLIRKEHLERVRGYVDRGESGQLVYDGRRHDVPREGYFIGPSVFDHVEPTSPLAVEEIFGPILSVVRVATLDDAIALANRSEFGNSASIYTESGGAVREFRNAIECGMLGVNLGVPAPMAFLPFAGWKRSFYGDLHANGMDGLAFYTAQKVMTTRWYANAPAGAGWTA